MVSVASQSRSQSDGRVVGRDAISQQSETPVDDVNMVKQEELIWWSWYPNGTCHLLMMLTMVTEELPWWSWYPSNMCHLLMILTMVTEELLC